MFLLRLVTTGLLALGLIACGEKKQEQSASAEKDKMTAETSSDVPELWEFHEVIYQIWHEAWPEKNTTLLKDLIPDIEAGFAKLEQVSLPGILREKQEPWSEGIQEMSGIIDTYKKAANSDQKEALLKAAEDLHSKFEQLVRLIRPVMKEIDYFHQELYMLYHYYMPEYDIEKISASVTELIARMEPIKKANLPARLKDKQQEFEQSKSELSESLNKLQKVIKDESQKEQVLKAIEIMHTKYQIMVGVFE
jgi:uncharacterized protein (UPF0305 family)